MITQPDHARLASQILGLWHAGGLPDHPRRDDLLFAVAEHDNGWREADAAPYVDPASGRPHTFLDLPERHRREIWSRAVERFASSHPYAALLILEHARALHRDRCPDDEWQDFFASLEALRGELVETTGAGEDQIRSDYDWLALADDLSLALCTGRSGPFERHGVRARVTGSNLELAPFPLVGATTFEVPCRMIEDRRFAGDADLGVALARARWERLAIRLRAPGAS